MKTLTNIRKFEKHLRVLVVIGLFVSQAALKASEVPPITEEATEIELMVEDWMLDLSTWAKDDTYSIYTAKEEELEIEDWMVNPNDDLWNTNFEEELQIEDWMYDVNHCYWNGCTVQEQEMPIEKWMVDTSSWLNSDVLCSNDSF